MPGDQGLCFLPLFPPVLSIGPRTKEASGSLWLWRSLQSAGSQRALTEGVLGAQWNCPLVTTWGENSTVVQGRLSEARMLHIWRSWCGQRGILCFCYQNLLFEDSETSHFQQLVRFCSVFNQWLLKWCQTLWFPSRKVRTRENDKSDKNDKSEVREEWTVDRDTCRGSHRPGKGSTLRVDRAGFVSYCVHLMQVHPFLPLFVFQGSTVAREASDKEKVSTITPPSCPGSTGQGFCSFFSSPTAVVLPLPLLLLPARTAPVQPGDACLHHLPRWLYDAVLTGY